MRNPTTQSYRGERADEIPRTTDGFEDLGGNTFLLERAVPWESRKKAKLRSFSTCHLDNRLLVFKKCALPDALSLLAVSLCCKPLCAKSQARKDT